MKEEIIDLLIKEQQKIKEDLETEIENRQHAADIDEGDTRDDDDYSQQEVNKDFVRRFREQIDIANRDLNLLQQYKFKKSDSIEDGALVETKEFYFVVGVSTHNMEFKKKKVVGISKGAPVYEFNEGKTKKDKMKIGKKEVDILSIS